MFYKISEDLLLVRKMLQISQQDIADAIGVDKKTITRIENKESVPGYSTLDKIYNYFFLKGIRINNIKEMLYKEELKDKEILLFHGTRTEIKGDISPYVSRDKIDFGKGFYCGDSSLQTVSFIKKIPESSYYVISFEDEGLKSLRLEVNQEWMLAVAFFRGTLDEYKNHPLIKNIIKKIQESDYIIAPIADNRMFRIIDQFIDGLITDEQCKHCLAATNLGYQYVFFNEKAVSKLTILERLFISSSERKESEARQVKDQQMSENKVKAAMIKYKRVGKYIEEILK